MICDLRQLKDYELFAQGTMMSATGRTAEILVNSKINRRQQIFFSEKHIGMAELLVGRSVMLFRPKGWTQSHYMLLSDKGLFPVYYA